MIYSLSDLQRTEALLVFAHAYAGGATCGHYSGESHLVLTRPFTAGRLKRSTGDALCKPHAKFWGLEPNLERDPAAATCKRCKEIAGRLNLLGTDASKHGT